MRRKAFLSTLALFFAPLLSASAETVPVTFTLGAPSGTNNIISIKIDLLSVFNRSDTETTVASGTLNSNLEIDFDPATRAPTTTGIAFVGDTPGNVSFTNMNFLLDLPFPFPDQTVVTNNLRGTLNTVGVGPVSAGVVPMEAHDVILNQGTLTYAGLAAGSLDVTAEPVIADATGSGMLTITKLSDTWTSSTYSATLNVPFAFMDTVLEETTPVAYTVNLTASGNFVGSGNFTQNFTPTAGYWDTSLDPGLQTNSATWGTGVGNWSLSPAGNNPRLNWFNGVEAIFSPSGNTLISVMGTVEASNLTFLGSGYTLMAGIVQLNSGTIRTDFNTTINSTLSGTNGLTKIGPATLILGRGNSYTGTTNINVGTILANNGISGSATGDDPVNVAANAGVGGIGAISGLVTVNPGGALNLGANGFGTLILRGGLVLNSASLNFDLGLSGGSDMVQLHSTALTANGVNQFNFTNMLGFGVGSYSLIDYGTFTGSLANFSLAQTMLGGLMLSLEDTGSAIVLNVAPAGPPEWIGASGANWTTAGSWSPASAPNSATAEARFLGMGGSPVNLDASQTVNKLTFNTGVDYTLSGPAANVLSLAGTNPVISTAGAGDQNLSVS
ncbi:MAG: hypothetical protein SFX18_04550, partial [Pirellulales bacterium]|nr:hypothetical protein [Pirellulales bacterium]